MYNRRAGERKREKEREKEREGRGYCIRVSTDHS